MRRIILDRLNGLKCVVSKLVSFHPSVGISILASWSVPQPVELEGGLSFFYLSPIGCEIHPIHLQYTLSSSLQKSSPQISDLVNWVGGSFLISLESRTGFYVTLNGVKKRDQILRITAQRVIYVLVVSLFVTNV